MSTQQSQQGGGSTIHLSSGGGGKSLNLQGQGWQDFIAVLKMPQVREQFENAPEPALTCYEQVISYTPVTAGR